MVFICWSAFEWFLDLQLLNIILRIEDTELRESYWIVLLGWNNIHVNASLDTISLYFTVRAALSKFNALEDIRSIWMPGYADWIRDRNYWACINQFIYRRRLLSIGLLVAIVNNSEPIARVELDNWKTFLRLFIRTYYPKHLLALGTAVTADDDTELGLDAKCDLEPDETFMLCANSVHAWTMVIQNCSMLCFI